MNKIEFESKSLVYFILISYILNILIGGLGFVLEEASRAQLFLYQVGNAMAITGSVMAGRYTGLKSQHVSASGFILLGIAHGISLGALSRTGVNADRGVTMILPMIPALISMIWCDLFPRWLRVFSMVPILFFTLTYIKVESGESYFNWPLNFGFATLQIIELLWAIYIFKDWKKRIE
jgi:hypothetical protein